MLQLPSSEEIERELDHLLTSAIDDSIGSIDHATNAKVIALKDQAVKHKLTESLTEGYRLKSITPLVGYGGSPLDFRLRFLFGSDALIDLPRRDFIVSVELPARSVKRILDDQTEGAPISVQAPFTLAVPSQATEYRTPASELQGRSSLGQEFLAPLSLSAAFAQASAQGYNVPQISSCDTYFTTARNTVWQTSLVTNVSTASYSRGFLDDQQVDQQPDWVQDSQTDLVTDYQYDCI